MADDSIDVVLTDPDYGVGINYEKSFENWSVSVKRKTIDELRDELIPFIEEAKRVAKRDIVVFWSGSVERIHDFLNIAEEGGFNVKYMGIWYKPNGAGPSGNGLSRRFEVWFWIEGKNKKEGEWRFLPDVLPHNRITLKSKEGIKHPTQKPVDLMKRLIHFFSKRGDVILDPFLGSGTTMYAAQDLGRSCIGIEINPEFCEMAKTRCFSRRFLDREVNYEFVLPPKP